VLTDLLVGVAVVVALVLGTAFVWPLFVFLLELVAVAVLVAARFALGRWTVVAETVGRRQEWRVRGRGVAGELAAAVAESLRSGRGLPPNGAPGSTTSGADAVVAPTVPSSDGHVRVLRP
jgi:hypothetical protein